jgi:uncharacterized protein YpuA (DUF1002 family)
MTDAISWRNPQVLRVLILVFIAGGLSGAVAFRVARLAVRHEIPAVAAGPTLRDKEQAMALLKQELNLTPDQSDRVSVIIDDYKRYYGNIQDQVEEVRATGKNKILEVLDPQQRTKFEKLAERLK